LPAGAARCPRCGWPQQSCACAASLGREIPPKTTQRVRVEKSSAGRGGKTVTVVTGIEGGPDLHAALAKKMKARCGAGGTVKDGAIEIQGDHAAAILELLATEGYRPKRSGG
jgi:translation initiation factor 1